MFARSTVLRFGAWLVNHALAAWLVSLGAVGHLRRARNYVRRTWSGGDPVKESRYHSIYVHYDREGTVHDYVIDQLKQLVAANYRITFVSNSLKFDASVASVRPFCREVLWRRNVGYDFGAYKDGIAALGDLSGIDRLLLMNDSVYGPFTPLTEILRAIDPTKTDIWGITDSWDGHYHVQSYFILFFKEALLSEPFRRFWRRMPYVNSKLWIIRNGETKLTQQLTRHKLRAMVLCPYWDVAKSVLKKLEIKDTAGLAAVHKGFLDDLERDIIKGIRLNPAHFFWETLISDFKCPFIKRELIELNPSGIIYAWRWPEVLKIHTPYNLEFIHRHLQAK